VLGTKCFKLRLKNGQGVGLQPLRLDNCKRARPMAPARSSTRRGAHISPVSPTPPVRDVQDDDPAANKELFLDPMLGTPLAIFIEKDVENKDDLSQLIIVGHIESLSSDTDLREGTKAIVQAFSVPEKRYPPRSNSSIS